MKPGPKHAPTCTAMPQRASARARARHLDRVSAVLRDARGHATRVPVCVRRRRSHPPIRGVDVHDRRAHVFATTYALKLKKKRQSKGPDDSWSCCVPACIFFATAAEV